MACLAGRESWGTHNYQRDAPVTTAPMHAKPSCHAMPGKPTHPLNHCLSITSAPMSSLFHSLTYPFPHTFRAIQNFREPAALVDLLDPGSSSVPKMHEGEQQQVVRSSGKCCSGDSRAADKQQRHHQQQQQWRGGQARGGLSSLDAAAVDGEVSEDEESGWEDEGARKESGEQLPSTAGGLSAVGAASMAAAAAAGGDVKGSSSSSIRSRGRRRRRRRRVDAGESEVIDAGQDRDEAAMHFEQEVQHAQGQQDQQQQQVGIGGQSVSRDRRDLWLCVHDMYRAVGYEGGGGVVAGW
jgi:hypothetical protein